MTSTKRKSAITADQIPNIFDNACIEDLARIGKLPPHANRQRFADGIRDAARIYATEIREPNDNEVRAEIESLYRAAERQHFDKLATLVEKLSSRARKLLTYDKQIADRPSAAKLDSPRSRRRTIVRWRSIRLPSPEALRDDKKRDQACALVVEVCQYGGGWTEGRKRPSGKRSWTWRPYLRAPEPRRQFPKREAERTFAMWLRIAWLGATGEEAPRTVDPRRPGPFARMVRECLTLVGAGHADAIGLLNGLNQIRREMSQRSALPPLAPNKS